MKSVRKSTSDDDEFIVTRKLSDGFHKGIEKWHGQSRVCFRRCGLAQRHVADLLHFLQQATSVRSLQIFDAQLDPAGWSAVAQGVVCHGGIEEVDFSGNKFGEAEFSALAHLCEKKWGSVNCSDSRAGAWPFLQNLVKAGATKLFFDSCEIDDAAIGAGLMEASEVEHLSLRSNRIESPGACKLLHSLIGSRVKVLNLSKNQGLGSGIGDALQTVLKRVQLEDLDLSSTALGVDALRGFVAELPRSSLKRLVLDRNKLRGDGARLLADILPECKNLRDLSLFRCKIDDAAQRDLALKVEESTLESLNVADNVPVLSEATCAKWKKCAERSIYLQRLHYLRDAESPGVLQLSSELRVLLKNVDLELLRECLLDKNWKQVEDIAAATPVEVADLCSDAGMGLPDVVRFVRAVQEAKPRDELLLKFLRDLSLHRALVSLQDRGVCSVDDLKRILTDEALFNEIADESALSYREGMILKRAVESRAEKDPDNTLLQQRLESDAANARKTSEMAHAVAGCYAVSHQQFVDIDKEVRKHYGTKYSSKQVTMLTVVEDIIKPRCQRTGKSVAEELNGEKKLSVDLFVTHSWREPWEPFAKAVIEEGGRKLEEPNLFICSLALKQGDAATVKAQVGASVDTAPFLRALRQAKQLLVVRNAIEDIYTRMWCVAELVFASDLGFVEQGRLIVTGPDGFKGSTTGCKDARCSNPEDRKMIVDWMEDREISDSDIDQVIQKIRRFRTL
mmetsp:Transcript_75399/g.172660  ORF Transcript_75399/g.172660 Transcript_75399/m.172660 type:complete len:736 (+) Transcript_75399:35-2242(+)|eukprot:CAMPEP_0204327332 /NCGR_PEP_ID=MMETSP0469-20131031/12497_1 /ASSEMBLY_ACC=CAM_ASM_000384 /TAXON_ID=2969 /ORGANISM="Oxyrrhis marina" /LENGTH=735 /DNA_ID=CAMNT_0051309539 /DNA_START=24 /DNA_END=2231 /DNA_ORIENTATION=+